MIIIREATSRDFKFIQQVAHQTWPITFGSILSREQIKYMLEIMYGHESLVSQLEMGHKFILAEEDDSCLGYASYEINYKAGGITKIHKIYILPNAQGKGVGKLLMKKIEQEARNEKNFEITLNVNRDNPAIGFYEKFGFKKIGQENLPIGNGFVMEDYILHKLYHAI